MEYHRPKTVAEALELLDRGVPLAGGTELTPRRDEVSAVIDLQELGLDYLESQSGVIAIGATVKLQAMIETEELLPSTLKDACRSEATLNLRNMATLGGTIMSADGRSPVATVLLAIDAQVINEPGSVEVSFEEFLDQRNRQNFHGLITEIRLKLPEILRYEQVSRAPADRPLVCVAAARFASDGAENGYRVVLGGFGSSPIRVREAEANLFEGDDFNTVVDAAHRAYTSAGDAWASGEYRAHAASVLVRRLVMEITG